MVYFVGAGPGDPDMITVKGRRLLEKADIIIYAGSLVSTKHLAFSKTECSHYNSAVMTLEEVINIIETNRSLEIVRLHTGDPSIYGAIREQMNALDKLKIEYEVVPGVSSFTAAAAAVKKEFTLPDVSQTVILTRIEGNTPVPETETLLSLAKHKASMAIFLSVHNIEKVAAILAEGYGDKNVPVAVVYRASWKDEKIITGTASDIAEKVRAAGITKTAQILAGYFINAAYSRSKLYDPEFSHEFRKSESPNSLHT